MKTPASVSTPATLHHASMPVASAGSRVLRYLASAEFTLLVLAVLFCGVLWYFYELPWRDWAIVVPLGCGAVNLVFAILLRPVFRSNAALLWFHLALLGIVLLVAMGRLSHMNGTVELSEGQEYSGQTLQFDAGVLHRLHLDRIRFRNEEVAIEYHEGVRRGSTRNRVSWTGADGRRQEALIGDHRPLVLDGYRFYTTFNKGFAPTFTWLPADASPAHTGTVHLPSYPLREFEQARQWRIPGLDAELWTMLVLDEEVLDPGAHFWLRAPARHHMVLRHAGQRHELLPGEQLDLDSGTLRYDGLRMWMGYRIYYDWTRPWLAAACLVGIVAMAAHFRRKFAQGG